MKPQPTFEFTTHGPAPAFPSRDEIEHHLLRSRQLRAQATSAMLASAGRAVAPPFRVLRQRFDRWRQQQRTRAALSRCSDRVLADVGIERRDIPLIARGITPATSPTASAAPWRTWHDLRLRWHARREQHRLYRELAAYDDRELDELGVRRADIRTIVSGRMPEPAFQ